MGSLDIGEDGVTAIFAALPRCPALATLDVSYNVGSRAAAVKLEEVLPACAGRNIEVNLSYNCIGLEMRRRLQKFANENDNFTFTYEHDDETASEDESDDGSAA